MIVLGAGIVSVLIGHAGLDGVNDPWKLIPYATIELATIALIYGNAWNRTGMLMSVALAFAWLSHVALYVDLITGLSIIYDRYEMTLVVIAVAQLIIGYAGFLHIGRAVAQYLQNIDAIPGTAPIFGAGDLRGVVRCRSDSGASSEQKSTAHS